MIRIVYRIICMYLAAAAGNGLDRAKPTVYKEAENL